LDGFKKKIEALRGGNFLWLLSNWNTRHKRNIQNTYIKWQLETLVWMEVIFVIKWKREKNAKMFINFFKRKFTMMLMLFKIVLFFGH
jgi:hypothetical protein